MSRDPDFYYTQAERLVSEGKFAAAELMLRQAVALGGNNAVYTAALAALLGMQEGRVEESLEMLATQLAEQPDEPSLLVAQALTARAAGQTELAEKSLRHVVQSDSNHAFAHHTLSRVLLDQGQMKAAEVHACKAFALVPDQAEYALGAIELLEASGNHDHAYEVASIGASFCPGEMELVQKALQGALEREEPDRAWDTLLELDDELPWVVGWKATLLDYQGKTEQADALLDAGRYRYGDEPEFLFLEAAVLTRRQQNAAALEVLEHLLALAPTHRGALRLRADLAFSNHSSEEGLADLQAMLELEPEDADVALELGQAFYRARRYREGVDLCQARQAGGYALQPALTVYFALSLAGLGEVQEALEQTEALTPELADAALTELTSYGCGNAAETALRDRLEALIPEPAAEAEPGQTEAAEAAENSADEAAEEEQEEEEEGDLPSYSVPISFSPALDVEDEDEELDDDEVWVEIDEETGEEYIWVDDDDDDEHDG